MLFEKTPRACFAPNVMTFKAFADQILKFSGRNIAPLSPVAKRTLLRNIITEFCRTKRLTYFAPIAHTSGFLDLVMSYISELKRDEVWPEEFQQACRSRGETDKDRELTLIYQKYQDRLLEQDRYDDEGRFWSARDALANGCRRPFEQLSLVVVDGFADFTHTQYEILAHLAGFSERMMFSLQSESPLKRNDLFAKTESARKRIEETVGSATNSKVKIVPLHNSDDSRDQRNSAFVHIAERLFDNPREITLSTQADGIEIVSATGRLGEVQAIAERVKRLLLSNVPADEIVIAVRNLKDYADLFEEVFQSSGIPYWCEAGFPISRASIVKALFAVIQLEREDWPFSRLATVLQSNYFRPDWKESEHGTATRGVLAQLRRLKIPSQRHAMLKGLSRAANRKSETAENHKAEQAAAALQLLERLSEATKPLRKKANFDKWTETLIAIGRELGIAPKADQQASEHENDLLSKRDFRVWDRFVGILREAAKAERDFSDELPNLSLSEFQMQLSDILESETLSPQEPEQGKVLILEADPVRNLDIPYLYLAGLTETGFPQSHHDDCLYGETERRQLNKQGLTLRSRSSRSQDEMLLFYNIVTRARCRLTLSYPSVQDNGQPLYPSPYLTTLKELFDHKTLSFSNETRFDPIPERERIMTPADLRLLAVTEARNKRPGLFRTLFEWPRTSGTALNVLAAIDMAAARFQTRDLTAFDGLVQHSRHVEQLKKRFPADYQFSATNLESYAVCAFRFFASKILHVEPLESPETSTDYLSRGSLVHDVLATVHRELAEGKETTLGIATGEIVTRFRESVDERLNRRIDDSDLQKALTHIEQQLLHEWAEAYGLQYEDYFQAFEKTWDVHPSPHSLETPFGDVPEYGNDPDEQSHQSLTFGSGEKQTFVQGRIDRIDIGQVNNQPVFNVIDYKSGKPPRFSLDDVSTGRAIQLVLYTLAVQRLDLAGPDAKPFLMGYWSIRETGFVGGMKGSRKTKLEPLDEAVLQSLEAMLEEVIPKLAAGIRSGMFPVNNEDPDCTTFCAYNTVCRVNQIRALQ
ncbi:MAG: exodeoxyribonuclease V subunit gamma [Planctomycetes bacterium]|nr:exodeoxyribonuclease V subunit gamma [Planctomycetota bacterium]